MDYKYVITGEEVGGGGRRGEAYYSQILNACPSMIILLINMHTTVYIALSFIKHFAAY